MYLGSALSFRQVLQSVRVKFTSMRLPRSELCRRNRPIAGGVYIEACML